MEILTVIMYLSIAAASVCEAFGFNFLIQKQKEKAYLTLIVGLLIFAVASSIDYYST